jgi:hypothetical protein
MRLEQALDFVDKLVFSTTGERLDKAQRLIFTSIPLWELEKRL